MQNSKYYPFERNRFFYGKLLTVRDFESEQKYFNDKRRLLNRLLFGSGVVAGLQVVKVDDRTISVEAGLALDRLGREIVVPSPKKLQLSSIPGFTNNDYSKNVYLCIAYAEQEKETVHSVANSSVGTDEVSEFNRIFEDYRVFIKEEPPTPASFETNLLEETTVLYQEKEIRLLLKTPRYVNPNEKIEALICVEKTLQTPQIEWNGSFTTEFLYVGDGQETAKSFSFVAEEDKKRTTYEFPITLYTGATAGKEGHLFLEGGSKLRIGDREITIAAQYFTKLNIIEHPIHEQYIRDYYRRPLDTSLEAHEDCLYLAKINLIPMKPTYIIENVEEVPFNEYVLSTSLQRNLNEFYGQMGSVKPAIPEQAPTVIPFQAEPVSTSIPISVPAVPIVPTNIQPLPLKDALASSEQAYPQQPQDLLHGAGITTGLAEIKVTPLSRVGIKPFTRAEQSYHTHEIEHGLGLGNVMILTSIEEKDSNKVSDILGRNDCVYSGDAGVFKDTVYASEIPQISIGTLVYPNNGTFRIGIKLLQPPELVSVKVRWWAYKTEERAKETQNVRLETAASKTEE